MPVATGRREPSLLDALPAAKRAGGKKGTEGGDRVRDWVQDNQDVRWRFLRGPSEFRETLLDMIGRAQKRCVVSCMYIGAEQEELINALLSKSAEGVKTTVTTDYKRSLRKERTLHRAKGSRSSLEAVSSLSYPSPQTFAPSAVIEEGGFYSAADLFFSKLRQQEQRRERVGDKQGVGDGGEDHFELSLVRMPTKVFAGDSFERRWWQRCIDRVFELATPRRWHEATGVYHAKFYVSDDDVLISGANLSNTYFTDRFDRYLLLRDRTLADLLTNVAETLGVAAYKLPRANGTVNATAGCESKERLRRSETYKGYVRRGSHDFVEELREKDLIPPVASLVEIWPKIAAMTKRKVRIDVRNADSAMSDPAMSNPAMSDPARSDPGLMNAKEVKERPRGGLSDGRELFLNSFSQVTTDDSEENDRAGHGREEERGLDEGTPLQRGQDVLEKEGEEGKANDWSGSAKEDPLISVEVSLHTWLSEIGREAELRVFEDALTIHRSSALAPLPTRPTRVVSSPYLNLSVEHRGVLQRLLNQNPISSSNLSSNSTSNSKPGSETLHLPEQKPIHFIIADPAASGFSKAFGLLALVPMTYLCSATETIKTLGAKVAYSVFRQSERSKSFHAKGIWYLDDVNKYGKSLIGSSNFSERSLKRDLEINFLIKTKNPSFYAALADEYRKVAANATPWQVGAFKHPCYRLLSLWFRKSPLLRSLL